MKVFQLIKRFFTEKFELNVPALVVCFALSCFLYYVYRSQTLRERAFTVPLTVIAENGIVPAGPHKSDVQVIIKGNPDDVNSLSERDFSAYLDLNYASSGGEVDVPVLLRLSDEAGRIVSLETRCVPGHVVLAVEEEVSELVSVEPQIMGLCANGFEVSSVSISPPQIRVTGPRSRVSSISALKAESVSVDGAEKDVSADVGIDGKPKFLKIDSESFSVFAEIVPVKKAQKIDLVRVNLQNIPENLFVSSQTENISLTIYGNQSEVEKWRPPQNLVTADCSKIRSAGRFAVPVSINLPARFSLTGEVARTVFVTFQEKKIAESEEGE